MNQRRNAVGNWVRFSLLASAGLIASLADARSASAAAVIKVSCIGEQTTHSDLFPSTTNQPVGMQEYPAMLQTLLGSGYSVMNYGDCCASVIQGYAASETHPYINGNKFGPSISFMPDIVIIGSWGRHDWGESSKTALTAFAANDTATAYTGFQADYEILVQKYIAAASKPKIYCSTPIPILFGADGPDNGWKTSPAATAVKNVCNMYNLPIIDLYTIFFGHKEYYINPPLADSEGEHISPMGSMIIAEAVQAAIMGGDGGPIAASTTMDDGGGTGSSGGAGDDATAPGSSGGQNGSSGSGGGSSSGSGGGTGMTSSGGTGATTGTATSSSSGSGSAPGSSGTGIGGSSSGVTVAVQPSSSGATTDTSSGSGGSNSDTAGTSSGCSVASGSEDRAPWEMGIAVVLGGALVSRRRNRRQSA